jgi:multidrug transporter EmrE-like cation transporter
MGDVSSKLWSLSDSKISLGGAIIFYFLGSIFMILSIKNNSLSLAVLVMPPLTILASVLIGHFYFGEKLF